MKYVGAKATSQHQVCSADMELKEG